MVYNEAVLLPVWLRHYAAQCGAQNCFVVDHGSTDGSTASDRVGNASILRIPRSPQDDPRRAAAISELCASLLRWYEAVVYTDVDELLLADPAEHRSLAAFASELAPDTVVTAAGLDIIHRPDTEAVLDWDRPVGGQRRWLRFSSAMCKPSLIRRPVSWAPGFHCIDAPPAFDRLFLFHLRYADLATGLQRLRGTRIQDWASPEAGAHQRMADADWEGMLRRMAGLPLVEAEDALRPSDERLAFWLDQVRQSAETRRHDQYKIDLHLSGDQLWRLPDRFVSVL